MARVTRAMRLAVSLATAAVLVFAAPVYSAETKVIVEEEATQPTVEYRVERLSFAGLPEGGAERELERRLNRLARQGWELDQLLEWSTSSALLLLRRN